MHKANPKARIIYPLAQGFQSIYHFDRLGGNLRETESTAEPILRRKFRLRRIRELFEFEDHLIHCE